jgi:heme/copper-type cytochrome/quinol oxidase subunit 3
MYWGLDVHIEGAVEGCHTKRVQRNLLFGFALFIISEVSLFRSFFWAFGHLSTNPSIFIGET